MIRNNPNPLNVLVVDDDPLINQNIQKQMLRLGYHISGSAFDGPAAVEWVMEKHPDLVLMDLQMIDPETGREDSRAGFAATAAILEKCPVPIVLLTAHESSDLARQAADIGLSGYVIKPAHDNELERAVSIACARHRDFMELRRLTTELQEKNRQLTDALAKVNLLSGLLPICAGCKKIRDNIGSWQPLEVYIQQHSEAKFSHGLCPNCVKKYYPDLNIH